MCDQIINDNYDKNFRKLPKQEALKMKPYKSVYKEGPSQADISL